MMGHEHELRVHPTQTLAGFQGLDLYAGATNPPAGESGYQFRYNWIELSVVTTGDSREMVVSLWPRIWTSSTRFAADRNELGGDEYCTYRLPLPSI